VRKFLPRRYRWTVWSKSLASGWARIFHLLSPYRKIFLAKAWVPRTLRYRLLGFFVMSLVVPILVTGGVAWVTSRQSVLEASGREQREMARQVGDRVMGYVGDVEKGLLTLASRGTLAHVSEREQVVALKEILQAYPTLVECAVIGPRGREVVKVLRQGKELVESDVLVNRSRRDEFLVPFMGRSFTGQIFFTQGVSFPQMFVSVPLGRNEGVLMARLTLENIWDLVSEVSGEKTGFAYIVDRKGNLLAHPERTRVLAHENRADDPVVNEFIRGRQAGARHRKKSPLVYANSGGVRMLAVHEKIPMKDLGWAVIVERPLSEALISVRAMGRRLALILVVLCGIFLAVGLSLIRKILEPLRALEAGVKRIGKGELTHRLAIQSDDEIARLSDEFNKMAESLGSSEQMKRDLTHMIVHDLKSPLSGVLGSLDYVISGALGPLNEQQKKILSLGSKSGRALLRLVQNLLDIAKLEEGKLELNPDKISLLELAAECVDDLEANIYRENKMVSVEIPPNLPKTWADRDLLYRVLSNLLANALKHTSRGAEIAIRAWLNPEGSSVIFSVHDNGEGIPKEYQKLIFDKFSQAEGKKRRFRIGSGLGLTFCKLAVGAHHGSIWVESEEGQGTEFFVQLPLIKPEGPSDPSARVEAPKKGEPARL